MEMLERTNARECPFCSPPPERIIHENKLVSALYDGFPVSLGHALIIPRRHFASWEEAYMDEKISIWEEIDEVRKVIADRYTPDGFNVGFNDGTAAGQTIMHLHVHVIPRYRGDVDDPRGGIRWVLTHKAAYWNTDGRE